MIRTASKILMFHGTATGDDGEIVRSILKKGLVPDPKQKAYESPYPDTDEDYYESPYESIEEETGALLNEALGGVYFTDVPSTAITFAEGNARIVLGGDSVLIAARIETRSPAIRLDEDHLINYVWGFATDRFEAKDPDTYYLELWDWLDDATPEKWETIGRGWIEKNYPDVPIREERWAEIQEPLGKAVHAILIHTFLEEHRKDAELEAFEIDPDHWFREMDYYDEIVSAADRYKTNIAIVAERLREVATQPSGSGEHRVRILEPVTYRGSNRIEAIVSWRRNMNMVQDGYRIVGTVHYANDTEAAQRMMAAIGLRASLWRWADGEVIYEEKL